MSNRWPEWLSINENLKDLSPYGAPQIPVAIRLNTNENPFSLDSDLQRAILNQVRMDIS